MSSDRYLANDVISLRFAGTYKIFNDMSVDVFDIIYLGILPDAEK